MVGLCPEYLQKRKLANRTIPRSGSSMVSVNRRSAVSTVSTLFLIGCGWGPHARLPPALLFSGRKDPRSSRREHYGVLFRRRRSHPGGELRAMGLFPTNGRCTQRAHFTSALHDRQYRLVPQFENSLACPLQHFSGGTKSRACSHQARFTRDSCPTNRDFEHLSLLLSSSHDDRDHRAQAAGAVARRRGGAHHRCHRPLDLPDPARAHGRFPGRLAVGFLGRLFGRLLDDHRRRSRSLLRRFRGDRYHPMGERIA
jgi:hypothetical protein